MLTRAVVEPTVLPDMNHSHILVGRVAGSFAADRYGLGVRTEQALECSRGPLQLSLELARSLHL